MNFIPGLGMFPRLPSPPNNTAYPHSGECTQELGPSMLGGVTMNYTWNCCGRTHHGSNHEATECLLYNVECDGRLGMVIRGNQVVEVHTNSRAEESGVTIGDIFVSIEYEGTTYNISRIVEVLTRCRERGQNCTLKFISSNPNKLTRTRLRQAEARDRAIAARAAEDRAIAARAAEDRAIAARAAEQRAIAARAAEDRAIAARAAEDRAIAARAAEDRAIAARAAEDRSIAARVDELKKTFDEDTNRISSLYFRNDPPCQVAYSSLVKWTNNFQAESNSEETPFGKLGEGAYGVVFKGLVIDESKKGFRVAVKHLVVDFTSSAGSIDDMERSFQREVHVLSQFKHPNIVKLVAYCPPDTERKLTGCLVYELLALGGLNTHLTDDSKAQSLSWPVRVNILFEIASAINYLHCSTPGNPAYHRDIKASNIALTSSYSAKLIDCGLSKYTSDDNIFGRSIRTATGKLAGTIGNFTITVITTTID